MVIIIIILTTAHPAATQPAFDVPLSKCRRPHSSALLPFPIPYPQQITPLQLHAVVVRGHVVDAAADAPAAAVGWRRALVAREIRGRRTASLQSVLNTL